MTQAAPAVQVLAVAVGAAAGGVLRWLCGAALNTLQSPLVLGTLAVNCVGGLLVGLALVWFEHTPNEVLRLLAVTGFLGGLTTFSSFSGESLLLIQRGAWGWAAAHTLAHVLGALAFAALGFRLGRLLWG